MSGTKPDKIKSKAIKPEPKQKFKSAQESPDQPASHKSSKSDDEDHSSPSSDEGEK
jgi:hypothetical protein